jgi:very-short-patch-repair endonuclease
MSDIALERGGEIAAPASLLQRVGAVWIHKGEKQGHRLVTRRELLAGGVSATTVKSWLRTGRLHRVFQGVYAVGHPLITREERWLAAVLACGPGAALSHLSAAALWGLIAADGEAIDVTVARGRKGHGGIRAHRRRTAPEAAVHRGIPTTSVAHTLLDLATTFTPAHLERALGEAQLLPFFAEDELRRALATGRPGVRALRAIWDRDERSVGIPRNAMERRFLKIVKAAGLPRPEVNMPWGRWEIDALWPELRVAVELDGRTYHQRRADFARDREKDRELQLAGLIALRFTYAEVMRRPQAVTAGCCRACASGPARAWCAASRTR